MRALRLFKTDVALLTALCDLGRRLAGDDGHAPPVGSRRRGRRGAVRFLFRQAAKAGDWLRREPDGYIVLGMGKYGAFELNYSSDIDLIVFYDLARIRLRAGLEVAAPSSCASRATSCACCTSAPATATSSAPTCACAPIPAPRRSPCRPTPPSTTTRASARTGSAPPSSRRGPSPATSPPATPCCEDLAPFIWRKYLDFAAIADIHAMKRQIHAFRGFGTIGVAGHNIKVGRGGIREIEFFVQTQQLIAGGRQPELRVAETLAALAAARGARLDHAPSVARRARRGLPLPAHASSIACR